MRKWLKHLKNQKGLTLIELLAVVVILGIIAAIAVPAIGNIIDNSKDDAHRSNALLIINAAKLGIVTDEVEPNANGKITIKTLVDEGLIDAVPSNPSVDSESYDSEASFVNILTSGTKSTYSITLTKNSTPKTKYFNGVTEAQINAGQNPNTP